MALLRVVFAILAGIVISFPSSSATVDWGFVGVMGNNTVINSPSNGTVLVNGIDVMALADKLERFATVVTQLEVRNAELATANSELQSQVRDMKCQMTELYSMLDATPTSCSPCQVGNTSLFTLKQEPFMGRIALSADEKRLYSWMHVLYPTILIWDNTQHPPKIMANFSSGHTKHMYVLVLSSDETHMYTGSEDHTIRVWNNTHNPPTHLRTITMSPYNIRTLIITRDESRAFIGSYTSSIQSLNLVDGTHVSMLSHGGTVTDFVLGASETVLYSASYDSTIRIWDVSTPQGILLHTLTGHTALVNTLALTSDETRLYSGAYDNTIRVWDVQEVPVLLHTVTHHTDRLHSLALASDNHYMYSTSSDGTIRTWNVTQPLPQPINIISTSTPVSSLLLSSDDTRAYGVAQPSEIRAWQVQCP
eukprot:m.10823 g.10823  ORF g.10823 m.10823 type:complete len:421 (+) comp5624_c0_seq1:155-1417(+)